MAAKHGNVTSIYTTNDDFCRIFNQQMDRLYVLAYLLTADPKTAEQCFVAGMADCVDGNPVFKEWANSWARRTIIKNALRMAGPGHTARPFAAPLPSRAELGLLAPITGLQPFERFVFVMLVLENYSVQECVVLLNSTRREVTSALSRAMTQMALANGAALTEVTPRVHDLRVARFWNALAMPDAKTA